MASLFTYYFQPGETYLGGDFFFPVGDKPDCIEYLENCNNATRDVLIHHIAVSAQIKLADGKVSNCLVHPSVRQSVHKKYKDEIEKEINWCKEHINDDFKTELEQAYNTLAPTNTSLFDFESIYQASKQLLANNEIKVLIMNGKNDIESSEYESGSNIVIGGNTLGRGVTFPGLHTIYYTRSSKKPQADTMWQHSRMFGYDRDPGMMKVYIDEHLYKLFSDINATNNSIIAQIERGVKDVKIFYPEGLNPTRNSVIDKGRVAIISGGTNYYPFAPDNDSIETISALLQPFNSDEPYYQVSVRLIKEILTHIIPSPDFKLDAFQSVLTTILSETPAAQGILIVRRERNVAQGTGALLSPNDWSIGGSFTDKPALTMYQVTGTKGWNGKQLWVPNIKLPHGIMYYDVIEDEPLQ